MEKQRRSVPQGVLGPAALCLFDNEMCDNEMSFSMMPQLSIMKTRFAKASLRPRCARHRSWGATCLFPNGCVGYSPTQWLRWSSSFPNRSIEASRSNRSGHGFIGRIIQRALVDGWACFWRDEGVLGVGAPLQWCWSHSMACMFCSMSLALTEWVTSEPHGRRQNG